VKWPRDVRFDPTDNFASPHWLRPQAEDGPTILAVGKALFASPQEWGANSEMGLGCAETRWKKIDQCTTGPTKSAPETLARNPLEPRPPSSGSGETRTDDAHVEMMSVTVGECFCFLNVECEKPF
jgi:hypothetical protein